MNQNIGLFALLMTFSVGLILSTLVYIWDGGSSPILYWGILPGLPFILITVYAGFIKQSASRKSFMGAVIAALIVTLLCYGSIYYDAINYTGGGVNIGLGMLIQPLPAYYLVFTVLGWYLGGRFKK